MTEPTTEAPKVAPRAKRSPLVAILEGGPAALPARGAALLAAHLIVEVGIAKASKMTDADVRAYASELQVRAPMVWPALVMGDPLRFVQMLGLHGRERETEAHYAGAMTALLGPTGFLG